MVATLLEYECPACGGALQFDAQLQKVKCPYCDSEFEVDSMRDKDSDLDTEMPQAEPECQWHEGENVYTYACQSCGGEILCDANTAATSCPYCNNPVVMKERLAGSLRPDLVIPFQLDREAAKAALHKHISGKILLPKCFKSENHIEKIQGVYVPFWLYDVSTNADISFHATKVRHWSDSNYNYTQTRHYRVRRAGGMTFEGVPVDGSTKMADALMESIEPYDISKAVNFQTAYLAGYLADKYDVSAETAKPRSEERIRASVEETLRSTAGGYSTVTAENAQIDVQTERVRYGLMPVWVLNTRYQGKDYVFAMNGQTGKMVGDLPMSQLAYWLWFGGVSVIGTVLAYLLGLLLG